MVIVVMGLFLVGQYAGGTERAPLRVRPAALDATKALEVVEETHAAWAGLVTGATAADGLSVSCGEAAALAAKGVSAH